ncbi:1-acyl-sn-glycerol-3-phosphate acyltransferase [Paraburkholderia sp. LEh10]|uniref:lysophospholipid acyltransferase family protein n=1 Tax=Paraburkholderia sp. LEh10 TaxID=2821353 RepID=UPI001AE734DC|nr:lysophospholipid acyltransferase family protein [Paraburkholderia sp. LEh10]MBP0593906.1 1-acyl-sn-glycerol-3-phosphate acyltransferase [Paraburkholderia sp. LEh10]
MKLAFRKIRLIVHLLYGMCVVATRFPRASAQQRLALNRAWSLRMLQLCGMRLVVHNDGARLDEGVLVVANHISWIDIYVINAWRPTPFVSKAEIRKWPVVGWCAQQLGTVFIQREKRSDAKRIMHELAARLDAGELMCVFPEGTTSDGAQLLPFHANMFQAAVSASRPVQPVCLMYEDAWGRQSTAPAYIGDMSLGESLDALLRGGPLTAHVYVGAPLAPGVDRRLLAAEAQASVSAALAALQDPDARRSGQIADRTQEFIDAASKGAADPMTGSDADLTRHA